MEAVVGDLSPKTIENAKRQFVEVYGSAVVMNTYLRIAVVLLALLASGLLVLNFRTQVKYANVKPLVIRIDDVGRAGLSPMTHRRIPGRRPVAPDAVHRDALGSCGPRSSGTIGLAVLPHAGAADATIAQRGDADDQTFHNAADDG
jgi:hypothetical protein